MTESKRWGKHQACLSLRLPQVQRERYEQEASQRGVSVAVVVRERLALADHLLADVQKAAAAAAGTQPE